MKTRKIKLLIDILTKPLFVSKKAMDAELLIKVTPEQRKKAQQAVFKRELYSTPCALLSNDWVVNDSDYSEMKSFCN